jgi:hypothetical protein
VQRGVGGIVGLTKTGGVKCKFTSPDNGVPSGWVANARGPGLQGQQIYHDGKLANIITLIALNTWAYNKIIHCEHHMHPTGDAVLRAGSCRKGCCMRRPLRPHSAP